MRINRVKKARKDQGKCQMCGERIDAGNSYKWIKHRYGSKQVRHTHCRDWRPSELTTSDKLSVLYETQEKMIDFASEFDGKDLTDVKVQVEEWRGDAEEVADAYRESADSMEEYFPGSERVDELNEKADECDEWASRIEQIVYDLDEPDEDTDMDEWQMAVRDAINDAADDRPL